MGGRFQFSDEKAIRHFLLGEAAVGSDDAEGHGEVESRAFFFDVGRGEVDGDMRGRDVVAAVFQRGADAVAALADSGVWQADGVEVVLIALDAGAVDLDLDDVGIDAVNGGAESFVEHEVEIPALRLRSGQAFSQRARETGHPGTRSPEVPDIYLTDLGLALAVTDVTKGLWKTGLARQPSAAMAGEFCVA